MLITKLSARWARAANAGFTLLELLVVIAVLGILAAIAIQNLAHTSGACNQRFDALRSAQRGLGDGEATMVTFSRIRRPPTTALSSIGYRKTNLVTL